MTRRCIVAGCPAHAHRDGPRCQTHQRMWDAERNHRRTQYRGSWQRTSRAAREAEPWCHCPGCPNCAMTPNSRGCVSADLGLDHEFNRVECRACNSGHRRSPA